MKCLLCNSLHVVKFGTVESAKKNRKMYFKCNYCCLIFLSPEHHLSLEEETTRYKLHKNDPNDVRYVTFLSQLVGPLSRYVKADNVGLDYGCGPGPTISVMFYKKGIKVINYDPIFQKNDNAITKQYNFITCSETIEHFYNPHQEFITLNKLLKEGGIIGLMTGVLENESSFFDWWYIKDPTHVCFYQYKTFEWIEKSLGWKLQYHKKNVFVFSKM